MAAVVSVNFPGYSVNILEFKPLIKNLIKEVQEKSELIQIGLVDKSMLNSVVTMEDLEQEMWIKLIKIIPNLENSNQNHIFKVAQYILRNHLIDIVRSQERKKDTSVLCQKYDTEDELHTALQGEMKLLHGQLNAPSKPNSFDSLCKTELKDIILEWAATQDECTQKYLKEKIDPSDEVLDKLEEIETAANRFSSSPNIRPQVLGRILNIKPNKIYDINFRLKRYLNQFHDYELNLNGKY